MNANSKGINVLAVMDAYSVPGQVCCGFYQGGGYDENGNGEPPSCCGKPFTESDMQDARAAVAELVEAARSAHAILLDAAREVDAATALHCEAISDHLAAALAGCGVVP